MNFKDLIYIDRKKGKIILDQGFAGILTGIIIISFLFLYSLSIPDQNLKEIKVTSI